ncbi:hypothetical protein QO002_001825 [Pararhizobium capsulatum DSM 1112]|uniref:Uncharacterized protein n=1 Tax=Pararhizobium capsulatum DSM 1112 TaxID=1121113 RepID=A0ABU0BS25_9HYPH|nr:hypothetical protein [Pararhizobium capsulatum]MDQ0319687.1 hypothetical protein [Pararhizobium capsulatum DSM 1112]
MLLRFRDPHSKSVASQGKQRFGLLPICEQAGISSKALSTTQRTGSFEMTQQEEQKSPAELLVERILARGQSGQIDWRQAREEIHDAHDLATNAAERVLCLGVHKAIMDAVERHGAVSDVECFRKTRRQDYNLLLIKEVMIGKTDGLIDPIALAEITGREVAAGRMPPDDEFHKLATAGAAVLAPLPPRRPGFLHQARMLVLRLWRGGPR